jgi:predicted GNAT superfamily acetyltransferase
MEVVSDIYDGTIPEFQTTHDEIITEGVKEFKRLTQLDSLKTKASIYTAFKDRYDTYIGVVQNQKNVLSESVKRVTTSDLIKQARLYLDVAIPVVVEMAYADYNDTMDVVAQEVTAGMSKMASQYDKSMLGFKNVLQADISTVKQRVDMIYDKHRTRTMYKQLVS